MLYDWILPAIRQVDPKIIAKPDMPPFTLIADRNMEKRVYLWITACLANERHSDFILLKTLVIKEHLELMKQKACNSYLTAYLEPRLASEKMSSG